MNKQENLLSSYDVEVEVNDWYHEKDGQEAANIAWELYCELSDNDKATILDYLVNHIEEDQPQLLRDLEIKAFTEATKDYQSTPQSGHVVALYAVSLND